MVNIFCKDFVRFQSKINLQLKSAGGGGGEVGSWNSGKYCRPPWMADKKNFRILDALEWLK